MEEIYLSPSLKGIFYTTEKIEQSVSYPKRKTTILFRTNRFLPFLFFVRFFFLGVPFSIATSASLTWSNDTSYPFLVSAAVAFTGQDHCIYVFGGENDSDIIPSSYKFNTTAGSPRVWTEIASMKIPVYSAAGCVANDGRFFIFGGSTDLQIYNKTNNSWITITPNMPSGASINALSMSCAVDSSSGLMYIIGGNVDGTRFFSYNVSSNTITNLSTSSSPTPFNLYAQGSFVNNGKLYVFGGYDDNTGFSSSTYIYDIANNSWSTGENMKYASCCFGYVTDGSRFYAIGGFYMPGIVGVSLINTQIYDISSGVWSIDNGTIYSEGMFSSAAVFLDGTLHSIGGYNRTAFFSVHRIASLCGVYAFSGPCDDGNRCTTNDTCQSNGQCIGTCISSADCNCTSISSSTSTTSPSTSSSSNFQKTLSVSIGFMAWILIILLF